MADPRDDYGHHDAEFGCARAKGAEAAPSPETVEVPVDLMVRVGAALYNGSRLWRDVDALLSARQRIGRKDASPDG